LNSVSKASKTMDLFFSSRDSLMVPPYRSCGLRMRATLIQFASV
jgi:hypothetical protein